MTSVAEYFRPEQSRPLYSKAFQLLKEPTKKRTAEEAALDHQDSHSDFAATPRMNSAHRDTSYKPRKRLLRTCNAPTYKVTNTDGIKEDNVMIVIAPPRVKYVHQRSTILGRPTPNLTVMCDTLEDFVSHQAQSIQDIQHLLDTYAHRRLSSCRLSPQGLVTKLKVHRVIKAEAETMFEHLPSKQGSSPLESDSRWPVASCLEERNRAKLLHRPSVHIYPINEQINDDALTNTLPSANKATADRNDGFSAGRREQRKHEEEEEQTNQSLKDVFRALLHKAHHSRGESSSSSSDEFPFLLPGAVAADDNTYRPRDLLLEQQHGYQEAALLTSFSSSSDSLDVLEQLIFKPENAYVALCAALQESLNE